MPCWRAVVLLMCSLVVGCVAMPPAGDWPAEPVELADVPFHPQEAYQCGPAALATVLQASGSSVTPEALIDQVYLPGREGSLQPEMIAAVRRAGRIPLVLAPNFAALTAALKDRHPVLILQNLGVSWWPQWHYAVVVGVDADREEVLLRSGRDRRRVQPVGTFLRTWGRSANWALLVARPDEVPALAEPRQWLEAAQALAEVGQPAAAMTALKSATQRWPQQVLPWMLLGNLHYQQGDLGAAATAFRQALDLDPTPAAVNNLASVLVELHCPEQAEEVLATKLPDALPPALRTAMDQTLRELEQARQQPARPCQLLASPDQP